MKNIDWVTYLKILLVTSLILPTSLIFWSFGFNLIDGIKITLFTHFLVFVLSVLMVNYLEGESPFKMIYKNNLKK
jgi:hypothetical protein